MNARPDPDTVSDRESFERFVESLIADRARAEALEASDPARFQWGGANDWQNSSISTFLDAALAGARAQRDWPGTGEPTWRDLAVFLFLGKIYE